MNPDILLFRALNGFVGTVPLIDAVTRLLVNDFVVLTIGGITLAALWFSGGEDAQRAGFLTLIAVALTLTVVQACWLVYFRPRPFSEMDVKLLFYRPSMSSFPSLPIAMAFCFAEGARRASRRAGIFLYILGFLYGLVRVYAGVHYPLDVIAGRLIGGGMVRFVARYELLAEPFLDRVIALARRIGYA